MSSFRSDLLSALIKSDGESYDIQPLINEHCGDKSDLDQESASCRQKIVRVLVELMNMGWIEVAGNECQFSLSVSTYSHVEGKRIFDTSPILVRLTLKGEIDYKKSTEPPVQPIQITTYGDNSPAAGRDLNMGNITAIIGDEGDNSVHHQALAVHKTTRNYTVGIFILTAGLIYLILKLLNLA